MDRRLWLFLWLLVGLAEGSVVVDGVLEEGFRVLTVKANQGAVHFTVFRGDYLKFRYPDSLPQLHIPQLNIKQTLQGEGLSQAFFKMKDAGTFDFRLGEVSGTLTVVAYQGPGYQELTAQEAQEVLETQDPLLLDVRTRGEFQRGHLKNAMLIPIQELQRRFSELEKYKNQPILIYCATGNRSTVAAKILIDQGFEHISNLRYGIVDWQRRRLPVEGPLRP